MAEDDDICFSIPDDDDDYNMSDTELNTSSKIPVEEDSTAEANTERNTPNKAKTVKVLFPRQKPSDNARLRRKRENKRIKEKRKEKDRERMERRKNPDLPKQVPVTIESKRIIDATEIDQDDLDEEIGFDIDGDDFKSYYDKEVTPKVLITTSDNPHSRTRAFCQELSLLIPNSVLKFRNRSSVKKMVTRCVENGFTDIAVINEDMSQPNGMVLVHLPNGPTAHFRLRNAKLAKELKRNRDAIPPERPEVILNNFHTRLGYTIGRMLSALFPSEPDFKRCRAVTFHNQRDYIFFRHHRYVINAKKNKVGLLELGPRFTLRLLSLQHGTFDSKTGEYEWTIERRRHELETSRTRFFL